jgi:hypothetical protein
MCRVGDRQKQETSQESTTITQAWNDKNVKQGGNTDTDGGRKQTQQLDWMTQGQGHRGRGKTEDNRKLRAEHFLLQVTFV